MTTVGLATFCHPPRYVARLHQPGVLWGMVGSHLWPFNQVVVVHNKCKALDYPAFSLWDVVHEVREVDLLREEFDPLLARFGVKPDQPLMEEITHGEGAAHWWKVHVVNHLCALDYVWADYIVFADCDTKIIHQPTSWVGEGIDILEKHQEVLIVSPGDGAEGGGPAEGGQWPNRVRLTRNVSQQLFLCRTMEFRMTVNFDVPWDGKFIDGGPMAEWYAMLEGRLSRYMATTNQWRAILPDAWRYWHNSYWATDREPEGWPT